jgi:mannosyltransferase OCH1-like enzyme
MITKTFHRIWLGGKPMPSQLEKWGRSWLIHHPGWEMKTWTEDDLPELINQSCLSLCNTYSEMSDLIRYELLYKYGGIYIDTDFECFKNLEALIEDVPLFASSENHKVICGGFIGAEPENKYILNIIRRIPRALRDSVGKTSDLRIGPTFLTGSVPRDEIVVFPKQFFYPYLPGQTKLRDQLSNNKVAYAAHHWNASWLREDE